MRRRTRHDYPIEKVFDWGYIEIPLDWTTAQADKMVTIIGRIEEKIWTLYGDDLVNLAQQQHYVGRDADDFDHPDDTEDLPF